MLFLYCKKGLYWHTDIMISSLLYIYHDIINTAHLYRFLKQHGLYGSGIDCRITAFFSPLNGKISEKVLNDLDKAAVELVRHF